MEKTYDARSIESHWYAYWEQHGFFKAQAGPQDPTLVPYCIMLPPPNVTGHLHMGHAFQDTLIDILIRYHRMQGHSTLWQVGTDHAGIATQMVVERQLAQEELSRHDLGRTSFLDRVWAWKAHSGKNIGQQMRRLGASADWSRERFTMDEGLSKAVQKVFIDLYQQGLIYRKERLVNWDPVLQTALSDLEVLSEEEAGSLWLIRYPILGQTDTFVTVATTRPETLLGDSALAVHPEDERYRPLIGQSVILPLCDRTLPIIADPFVDPSFGTGCVKITPAHDFQDYEVGLRHQLPFRTIFTPDMKLNQNVPTVYQGLDRFEARTQILLDLAEKNFLVETKSHTLRIPRGDRSGAILEPLLTPQWYIHTPPLAGPALAAVREGKIQFVPKQWENTFFAWMEHIQDWCISRQLWWGHRIPAWYDEQGRVFVGETEAQIRQHHALGPEISLQQDPDVLDTWFSSALWPFSTLGWPEHTPELDSFYPTHVLVTGFDIIFFWVARMIMMGLHFTGKIPFKTVYVHGLIQDSEGQKMSKSKGNTIDPLDIIDGVSLEKLIEKRTTGLMQPHLKEKIIQSTRKHFPQGISAYGTDALRFTFCALASTGRHIRFDLTRVEGYRNFCNKLWNAARFITLSCPECPPQAPDQLGIINQWIWDRFQHLTSQVHQAFHSYRFDLAAQELYQFTWNTYCDWYLELSKATSSTPATRYTLVAVLEGLLRLLHPIIPFITEEIWQRFAPLLKKTASSIAIQPYPQPRPEYRFPQATAAIEWLQSVILALRGLRGERQIPPSQPVSVLFKTEEIRDQEYIEEHHALLAALAKCTSIQRLEPAQEPPPSISILVGTVSLFIPLSEFSTPTKEKERLAKELKQLEAEIQRAQKKLDNVDYLRKAPPELVEKERTKCAQAQDALLKVQAQWQALG